MVFKLCRSLASWRGTAKRCCLAVIAVVLVAGQAAESQAAGKSKRRPTVDQQLRRLLQRQDVGPLDPGPAQDPAQVALGQALFFDWELSGNRDTACATCHHPTLATGDALSVPIGTAAVVAGALGPNRQIGDGRNFVPRNAPEIFNRGSGEWTSQFWDSRVLKTDSGFVSPAGGNLPPGLPNVLAVQAMFPVTSRDEMRGNAGDVGFTGEVNEIALIDDADLPAMWDALMARLLAIPGYQDLFSAAYPGVDPQDLGFEHAAKAIGAFEAEAYTFSDSPWDRYLNGDNRALTAAQKRGALLFYGRANCSRCHAGSLMTDQQHYNIGVPQLGPGKGAEAPLDHGRGRETGLRRDYFRFRTPPLRNCEVTGPYTHNGAYRDLQSVIRHHSFPLISVILYNPAEHLDQLEIQSTYSLWNQIEMLSNIDYRKLPGYLSNRDVRDLVSFLQSLTAPNLQERLNATIPDSVPSGLPLDQ
ncbi:MAG: cytochrome c peroxidase [Planctomycetaceae bacterium]